MRLFGPEDMGADVAAEEPFGPYLVYERLGVGGMATVHRALERGIEGFERIVALKRLLPHLALDATFIQSFVREAKLASLLNHVNIVQIFQLGRVGTQYFISMEYIDGRDIRRILRHARKVSGPPPIHVTVGLLLQLCDALDYAHHKVDDVGHPMGLVHRDVSPSNVLVTNAGQVKVIDFGIAKAQSAQLRTQTGRVKGKLAYMAPEALAGKELDARSDLFAAGVIAHELLTARPLFASKNEYQTLMKVQRGEVMPPSTFNQACPPELDAIVLRALARDPDDRFAAAGELRDELHAMRRLYNLQTAARDIASWMEWAFQLQVPGAAEPAPELGARARHRRVARPRRHDDDEAIELAWGQEEHGNGEPIVLDDVPDVSDKYLQHASALGADVRLDLDDLGDDIPTPLPGHGKPTVDLAARTVTAPQLPCHVARNRVGTPARASATAPAQRGDSRPHAVAAPVAGPATAAAPAGDDATRVEISPVAPSLRSALVPARARTITMPPRAAPAASIAPRNGAVLPPRVVPAATEPSRGVPMPAASSRSGAIAAERSRSALIPVAPTRSGPIAAEPVRATSPGLETSQGIPVPIEPSYVGPAPVERSRSGLLPVPPVRSNPAATPPPRAVPSSSVSPPRERRATSPGTGTPPAGLTAPSEPPIAGRDTLLDMPSPETERTPVFAAEDLGLAADTMPAMPRMGATHTSASVVRFPEPAAAPAIAAPPPVALPPPAVAAPPAPPPNLPPAPRDTPPHVVMTTSTHRQRLITPATALFAEPDPDAALATSSPGLSRASHVTIPDVAPVAPRRVLLGRVVLVVLCLALVSAATTAAALYLTRDQDASDAPRPAPPPAPSKTLGTVHFAVVPADATIVISGKPITGKLKHRGSPWSPELAPGGYQIEIDREGYKGWLTSIDVVAGQSQTLHVPLETLGSAVIAEATLVVGSSPGGLDVTVDGVAFGKTPGKLSITEGHHVVALRAGDAEVWRKEIDARASAIYEFHPAIAAPPSPAAEPPANAVAPPSPAPAAASSGAPAGPPANTEQPAAGTTGSTGPAPAEASPPSAPAAPAADPASPAAPPPAAPPTGTALPAAATPVMVPAGAVKRLAGAPPRITPPAGVALPAAITAKLCIDDAGRVSTAELVTSLDAGLAAQITGALRGWRYAPYKAGGTAQAACFRVAFRT
jgi:hypothetical protein